MDLAGRGERWFRGGFLHVPYLPEQAARIAGAPSMSLPDIVRGIEMVLTVSAAQRTDIHTVEGRVA
jgi:pyroglutamyl-peptidase